MRLFIAIPVTDEVRAEIARIEALLRERGVDAKWVEPELLHVTLAFLGEQDEPAGRAAVRALDGVRAAPIELALGSLGAFPSIEEPRVLWAGFARGEPEMAALAQATRERLAREGVALSDEKPFNAHLTIGRPRGRGAATARAALEGVRPEPVAWRADRVALFSSVPGPGHPLYSIVAERRLS